VHRTHPHRSHNSSGGLHRITRRKVLGPHLGSTRP
jgi:hypothetical protein